MTNHDDTFLPQERTYRTLKCFQKAECIYDITYYFAHQFLERNDRTIDQMVQAARSGKLSVVVILTLRYIAKRFVSVAQRLLPTSPSR